MKTIIAKALWWLAKLFGVEELLAQKGQSHLQRQRRRGQRSKKVATKIEALVQNIEDYGDDAIAHLFPKDEMESGGEATRLFNLLFKQEGIRTVSGLKKVLDEIEAERHYVRGLGDGTIARLRRKIAEYERRRG